MPEPLSNERRRTRAMPSLRKVFLAAVLLLGLALQDARATAVTTWTDQADGLGGGNANWRGLAVMHMAMHDAYNAAQPTFARWAPPAPDEPDAAGADPQAAMETAGATVLMTLFPGQRAALNDVLQAQLSALPPGPARDKGIALGEAIGRATVARRENDGFKQVHLFPGSDKPGWWRPTPPRYESSGRTMTRPFLFADVAEPAQLPPPMLGGPLYQAEAEIARRLGGEDSAERTPAQTDAAIFWAYQSTQRGFVHLAATLVDARQDRLSLAEQARIMSQFTAAMADSAIIIWAAKEHWSFWRPVDAIRSGMFGVPRDSTWSSFIETPQHPEYPSGHASDCYTGAGLIKALLLRDDKLTYVAQSAAATLNRPAQVWSSDMGAQPAPVELLPAPRQFDTVDDAATECADSRIWAGAHFPAANEESKRIAAQIVERALAAVPKLP